MSVHSNWPEARGPRVPGDGSEPPGRWGSRTVILLLALAAAVVLCLTGVVAASLLRSDDPPPTLPAVVGEVSVELDVQVSIRDGDGAKMVFRPEDASPSWRSSPGRVM